MVIILSVVIGNAGFARVHIRASQLFRAHYFSGRSLHQRWTAEKDVPWFLTMIVSSDMAGT